MSTSLEKQTVVQLLIAPLPAETNHSIQCNESKVSAYKTNPSTALIRTRPPSPQMDPSTNIDLPLPSWTERPICRCGYRAKIGTSTKRATLGRRFFECPDLDDDFMVITFFQNIIFLFLRLLSYYPVSYFLYRHCITAAL